MSKTFQVALVLISFCILLMLGMLLSPKDRVQVIRARPAQGRATDPIDPLAFLIQPVWAEVAAPTIYLPSSLSVIDLSDDPTVQSDREAEVFMAEQSGHVVRGTDPIFGTPDPFVAKHNHLFADDPWDWYGSLEGVFPQWPIFIPQNTLQPSGPTGPTYPTDPTGPTGGAPHVPDAGATILLLSISLGLLIAARHVSR